MERNVVEKKYIAYSPHETMNIAAKVAHHVGAPSTLALIGQMGVGKTVFVKGFVKAKGCDDVVTSPTFTLVNQYSGSVPIYHFDVYRMGNVEQKQLDWLDDYLFSSGICIIEWAEFLKDVLPIETIKIYIIKDQQKGCREISVNFPANHN